MPHKQRRGEDEDFLLLLADFARGLQRPHHDEVGDEGGNKSGRHPDRRAGIGADMQIVAGGPGGDHGGDHQRAMGQIENAGDAEDQGKSGGAERVQRTDRKTVDQDLPEQHRAHPDNLPARGRGPERTRTGGRSAFDQLAAPSLMKFGNFSLPLATSAGHRLTCLPFCHCSIRPVMVPAPILSACGLGESLPLNCTRPMVPT